MTENLKPEGQTTSDNFLVSDLQKDFDTPQADFGTLSDEERAYLTKKGVKSPQQLLKSYRELEKAYSGKIALPKDGDVKAWDKFYSRLGMPKDSADFQIEFADEDKELGSKFTEVCLKNHILPHSAKALYDWYVQNRTETQERDEQTYAESSAREMEEVKQIWGKNADRNLELMKRGVRLFTDDDENLTDQLEQALGTKKMMTVFCKLGQAVSEDNPISFGPAQTAAKQEWNAVDYFRDMFNDY